MADDDTTSDTPTDAATDTATDTALIELERAGWTALSSSPEAARAFYGDVLADRVLMLLPGGMVIDERAAAIDAMGGVPWTTFTLRDERVVWLTRDSAVVAYDASARRGDQEYRALVSSTYVRLGDRWRLALHQQTPS